MYDLKLIKFMNYTKLLRNGSLVLYSKYCLEILNWSELPENTINLIKKDLHRKKKNKKNKKTNSAIPFKKVSKEQKD